MDTGWRMVVLCLVVGFLTTAGLRSSQATQTDPNTLQDIATGDTSLEAGDFSAPRSRRTADTSVFNEEPYQSGRDVHSEDETREHVHYSPSSMSQNASISEVLGTVFGIQPQSEDAQASRSTGPQSGLDKEPVYPNSDEDYSPLGEDEITVYGTIWYDKAGEPLRPVPNAQIHIVYWNPFDFDRILAGSVTRTDGQFKVSFENWALFGYTCRCYLRVFSRAPGIVDVFDIKWITIGWSEITHTWRFPVWDNVSGGDLDLGNLIVGGDEGWGSDDAVGGFRLLDSIVTAWWYIYWETSTTVPEVRANFPCDWVEHCFTDTPYFNPYYNTWIHMTRGQTNHTHVHEYAHFVMWKAYGDEWPVSLDDQLRCMKHSMGKHCDFRIGWSEGWANFLPLAVFGDRFYNNHDIESPPSSWSEGYGIEGRVAAALWDLYDKASDGCDEAGVGFERIFDTIWNAEVEYERTTPQGYTYTAVRHHHHTFRDFYDNFRARYPDLSPVIHAAAYQNTIDFDLGPPSVGFLSPNLGGWYSRTVRLTADAHDPDETGGVEVVFHYSTRSSRPSAYGGIWYPVSGTMTQESGLHHFDWETDTFESKIVWIRVVARDELTVCTGIDARDVSDEPFGVENTPPENPKWLNSSHQQGAWSHDDTISVEWPDATDIGLVQSGIRGYYYWLIGDPILGIPTPCPQGSFTSSTSAISKPAPVSAAWYFVIATQDNAGNCANDMSVGPYLIDVDLPSTPQIINPSVGGRVFPIEALPVVEWSEATDAGSGLAYYELQLSNGVICVQGDLVVCSPWLNPDLIEISGITNTSFPLTSLTEGIWYVSVRAVDKAGNVGYPSTVVIIVDEHFEEWKIPDLIWVPFGFGGGFGGGYFFKRWRDRRRK
jgi:hypothetical protein